MAKVQLFGAVFLKSAQDLALLHLELSESMLNLEKKIRIHKHCQAMTIICLLGMILFWMVPPHVWADDVEEFNFNADYPTWTSDLNAAEKRIAEGSLDVEATQELNRVIAEVRAAARSLSLDSSDKIKELERLSKALGPAPEEDEPPEARQVQEERQRLQREMSEIAGQAKQSDLIIERADQLLKEVSQVEMDNIVTSLTNQWPLPLDPRVWVRAGEQFFTGYDSLVTVDDEKSDDRQPILVLIPILAVCVFLSLFFGFWIGKTFFMEYRRLATDQNPGYLRKVISAIVVGFCRGIIPALAFTAIVGLLWNYWLMDRLNSEFTWPIGIYKAVVYYLLMAALIRAVFSPRAAEWNLISITADAAKLISHHLDILAAIITLTVAFDAVLEYTGKAAEFGSIYALIKNSIISMSLLLLSRKSLWKISSQHEEGTEESWLARLWFWPYLRLLTIIIATVALICSVLGFHNLADFLLPRIILTGCLAILIVTIRILAHDFFAVLFKRESGISNTIRNSLSLDQENSDRLNFWVLTIVDFISILASAYLLLVLWEPPQLELHKDLLGWLGTWFEGVSLGSYTFSLADLLLALLMLFVVLGLTRVTRSVMEHKLLPQTRMGIGARTAISSSIGYLGTLFAILIAVSTLGIDLSKLALIAGALSVGIGFGLQNIVNNFVSGLILLFEQPVKIGDWVVVGDLEGKVKEINVRATEIETFSRASVIIPNADLLQTSVLNWTHDSNFGRIEIPVGVGYDSDIEQVEAILLECGKEHQAVLSWPEPFVIFLDFGNSSLDFKLYFYVAHIESRLRISSDIRKRILSRFRETGIEIPFPQRVVTVNKTENGRPDDVSGVEGALKT